MTNLISNVPYDQIPHVVINHPETNPEHQAIMRALYKVLKDKPQCIYSNSALIKECMVSERTIRRRLDELERWGMIVRIGHSYARRFSLGILFNTTANMTGLNLNTPAKSTETPAKIDHDTGHHGRDTKTYTNPSTNENLSSLETSKAKEPTIEEANDFKWFSERPQFKMPKHLLWISEIAPSLDNPLD